MSNQYQLTDQVKLLQKAVLLSQDKFLILKRSPLAKTRAEQWDLPGGNVLLPTSSVDLRDPHWPDLLREIKEETGFGLDVSIPTQPCYLTTYWEAKNQTYAVIAGYSLDLPTSIDPKSVRLSAEHTAWAWITLAEFDQNQYDFGFAGQADGFITQIVHHAHHG